MQTLERVREREGGWVPMPRRTRLWLGCAAVALATAVLPACSALGGGGVASGDPFEPWDAEDGDVVVLDIQNRNTREARIYAHWNGFRTRVGSVRGMDDAQLQTEHRHGNLRIEVDFIGAGDFISPPYSVRPGEVVRFRIPN